jgi:crotonobetainyl-CoA:carnitine CoA-transferase CaiB-like acyl-CoA transferase
VNPEDLPFEGVRVVELAQWVFVPVAGALLADWGADEEDQDRAIIV